MVTKKFDQIDGLRFIAVLCVMLCHWSWSGVQWARQVSTASRGVDLFFVISGFLITLGLIRSKQKEQTARMSLYKFYIRRFLRIFPIYYLTLFIVYIFWHRQMAGALWWYALYLCNFHSIHIRDWGVAGQFWSLSVEEQFYLIWPFIILFMPVRRLPVAIIAAIFLSLAVKVYWAINGASLWVTYMHPIASLDILAQGALLAYLFHFHQQRLRQILYSPYSLLFVLVQLTLFISFSSTPGHGMIYNIGIRASFGLLCMWLIGRAALGFSGPMGYILNASVLRYIGRISYAIYLFHDFVPGMLMGLKYPENNDLRFLLYGLVTLAMASLSWYLFESRILKFKDRFE